MAAAPKMEFCEWASRSNFITPEQFSQVQSVCENEPSRDSGDILLELGYITPEEYELIIRQINAVKQLQAPPSAKTMPPEDNIETELDNRAILRERGLLPQDDVPTELKVSFKRPGAPVVSSDAPTVLEDGGNQATVQYDSADEGIPSPHEAQTELERTPPESKLSAISSSVNSDPVYARHYTSRSIIGRGGLGRVLLGFDRSIGREVAIKEILPEKLNKNREKVLARFLNEAKITGQLEHPGIVPVYELGVKPDGSLYYVMRHLRGNTMEDQLQMIQHQKLEPRKALAERLKLLDALIDVCDAMGYAHAKGFIHRDLKPANVVCGEFGETVILDWGLAKRKEDTTSDSSQMGRLADVDWSGIDSKDSQAEGLTVAGEILGTPAYMAPEQVTNVFGEVDQYSDVYALGVILFEILTGQTPYCDSPNVQTILKRLCSKDPSPSPADRKKHLPPELVAICRKAMSKYKVERLANAGEMAEELRAYRDGRLVNVYAYSSAELLSRFIDRHKYIFLIVSIVVIALLTASIFSLNSGIEVQQLQDELLSKQQLLADRQDEVLREMRKAHEATEEANRAVHIAVDHVGKTLLISTRTVENAERRIHELSRDLENAALQLQDVDLSQQEVDSELALLKRKYEEALDFSVIDAEGAISAVVPYDLFSQAVDKDVSGLEHIKRLFEKKETVYSRIYESPEEVPAIAVATPIIHRGEMRGAIYALIRPDRLLPLIDPQIATDGDPVTWAMQDNGAMLYDPYYPGEKFNIGVNMFFDDVYTDQADRIRFAKTIRDQPYGASGYEMTDSSGDSRYYIASWQTFQFAEDTSWKIVTVQEKTIE